MQLKTPKIKLVVSIYMIFFSFSGCDKNNLEDQITITINSIDNKTRQPRVNSFDIIEVRMEGFGLIKTFNKVGEYKTDATGSVKIKIDSTKGYMFIINGPDIYGSAEFAESFTKEKLKDGQEVNIEVIHPEI